MKSSHTFCIFGKKHNGVHLFHLDITVEDTDTLFNDRLKQAVLNQYPRILQDYQLLDFEVVDEVPKRSFHHYRKS